MKAIALSLLLAAALSLSTTAVAASLPADEPGTKEQPRKTTKAKKKNNHVRLFGRKQKESDYSRAMRRNEVLREPAEEPTKQ